MISPNHFRPCDLHPPSPKKRKHSQPKVARGSTHWYLGVWYGILHGTRDAIPTCRGVSLSLLRQDRWWCGQGLHGQGPNHRRKQDGNEKMETQELLGENGESFKGFDGSIFWRLMWYQENGARWQSCEVAFVRVSISQLTLPFPFWSLDLRVGILWVLFTLVLWSFLGPCYWH